MKTSIISDEQATRIDNICFSLKQSVTPMNVRNWLENFKYNDWNYALSVLEKLTYFTVSDIIAEYETGLEKITNEIPDGIIYLNAIGTYGKSGTAMLYYVKQTRTYKALRHRMRILSTIEEFTTLKLNTHCNIVFIDDIIGSGGSFIGYYKKKALANETFKQISKSVYILSIVCMREGQLAIHDEWTDIKVFATIMYNAFSSRGSVFGYRRNMLPIRHFCFRYGSGLFTQIDRTTGEKIDFPLGYSNSQSLVVFAHSSPNNTLPIIWANKQMSAKKWQPLYPRDGTEKIKASKAFRNENRLWAAIGEKLHILNSARTNNSSFTTELNSRIIAVVRLKKKKIAPPVICQILSLSLGQYEDIIKEGVASNIFDASENITTFGHELYDDLLRRARITRNDEVNRHVDVQENFLYIPSKFLGKA